MIPQAAIDAVNADPVMRRWGRLLDADVLLQVGDHICRFRVRDGLLISVLPGPGVMPSWTLAFRAEPEAWSAFMRPEPPPGLHDVMALVKRRALAIEGDLRPFMQHIFWFKGLFAAMRECGA
ncbi:MAG: hypothetical protein EOO66_27510 [Methylobacterium sp.]|nr:MAG: hypothetical protein EOO66_27510 [Methylobacterium sp.]